MAEEFRTVGVAVNALWPRTMIDTAASKHFGLSGAGCRTPEIMADAADVIFVKNSRSFTVGHRFASSPIRLQPALNPRGRSVRRGGAYGGE
jgi:hypothetical protein